jgi:hypothetical protein
MTILRPKVEIAIRGEDFEHESHVYLVEVGIRPATYPL